MISGAGELVRRIQRTPVALRGALLLVASTAAALVWANLPGAGYVAFWHAPLSVGLGDAVLSLDLRHWVNEALMAFFFALVTLEVRREFELGELRDWRRAVVPIVAAVAGLIVPAVVYLVLTWGTDAASGWGVVVSTDTAFVLGVLALVGRSIPAQVRVFLVTLAVADDVGALAVIAFAYTDDFDPAPLLIAALGLGIIVVMRVAGVSRGALYLLPAVVVWAGFLASGVHATLAGVAVALLLPVFPARHSAVRAVRDRVRTFQIAPSAATARAASSMLSSAISVNERAHRALEPAVTWVVLPLFALANAGVVITGESLVDAVGSRLTWAVIIGLIVGKFVGVAGAVWLIRLIRPGAVDPAIRGVHLVGVSILAGMGFTIALFVADLAFVDPVDLGRAQIGILSATVIGAVGGGGILLVAARRDRVIAAARRRLLTPVDPARDPLLGDAERAAVTVVEYGDVATPYLPGSPEMLHEMRGRFGSGVAYTFRHAALTGPLDRSAARAVEAAAQQGRFWEMRDAMIEQAPIVDGEQIRRAAAQAGLNLRRFERDWGAGVGAERVDADVADAIALGIVETPVFFIDGIRHDGAIDADSVNAAVRVAHDAALARR